MIKIVKNLKISHLNFLMLIGIKIDIHQVNFISSFLIIQLEDYMNNLRNPPMKAGNKSN